MRDMKRNENLQTEIDFLKQVFIGINEYPKAVVEKTLKIVRDKIAEERSSAAVTNAADVTTVPSSSGPEVPLTVNPHIILPFKGFKGQNILDNFPSAVCLCN